MEDGYVYGHYGAWPSIMNACPCCGYDSAITWQSWRLSTLSEFYPNPNLNVMTWIATTIWCVFRGPCVTSPLNFVWSSLFVTMLTNKQNENITSFTKVVRVTEIDSDWQDVNLYSSYEKFYVIRVSIFNISQTKAFHLKMNILLCGPPP